MSKVVFVGNVPYTMGEEQLIEVFRTVGQVIGFRLVFDRDTGKPKGYGFCEFADHDTALSAVRNLNNVDVGGRPLRIDLADSDPFLEGKTTVRGELIDGGTSGAFEPRSQWRGGTSGGSRTNETEVFLAGLPAGIAIPQGASSLDYISQALATMPPSQLMEVLAQMKAFVITHPDQARLLLVKHPQLAYALFQALLLNKIVDSAILQRMLAATSGGNAGTAAAASAPPPRPPMPAPPTHMQQPPPHFAQHPPPHMPPFPPTAMPPAQPMPGVPGPPMSVAPPASALYSHHQPPHPGMTPVPQYYRPPPPASTASPAPPTAQQLPQAQPNPNLPNISDSQKSMLMQVLSMTPEHINALPETERNAIMQLREQFMGTLGAPGN